MPFDKSATQSITLLALCMLVSACGAGGQTGTANQTQSNTVTDNCNSSTANATQCIPESCAQAGCGSTVINPDDLVVKPSDKDILEEDLRIALTAQSGGLGLSAYNEKVTLGQAFFHDNRFALDGFSDQTPSWSCSTCHTVATGFKPGIPQGIGEGGVGNGITRKLEFGFDPLADDGATNKPDMQPIAVPTMLNVAFQEVVLWNGQLGNASNGFINSHLDESTLVPEELPSSVNVHQLAGIESQAIAGQTIHRLRFYEDSPLQNLASYQTLWNAAYPGGSSDTVVDVAKAIAAFERTVFANQAPFQLWLRGDSDAMNESELAGANLFFGKAGCSACHTGPALSTRPGASQAELFAAIGFADFDNNKVAIHGHIEDAARLGRGGFTKDPSQNYQFKVPQLYNLADSKVLGHGASFTSIKAVIEYKNKAIAQNANAINNLDERFVPLNLSIREVNELTTFLTTALRDPDLARYQPRSLPQ